MDYLTGYPDIVRDRVRRLMEAGQLGEILRGKYPTCHQIRTEKALYDHAVELKSRYLRTAPALSKVVYDPRIQVIEHVLGYHTRTSRVHGSQLKTRYEIRVATVFKKGPQAFLDMILIHELAHFKERLHNKAFYRLCENMNPDYHQLEFDLRLYLTYRDRFGELYE